MSGLLGIIVYLYIWYRAPMFMLTVHALFFMALAIIVID